MTSSNSAHEQSGPFGFLLSGSFLFQRGWGMPLVASSRNPMISCCLTLWKKKLIRILCPVECSHCISSLIQAFCLGLSHSTMVFHKNGWRDTRKAMDWGPNNSHLGIEVDCIYTLYILLLPVIENSKTLAHDSHCQPSFQILPINDNLELHMSPAKQSASTTGRPHAGNELGHQKRNSSLPLG